MAIAGFGHPGDVLAQQIKLKTPIDQRFLLDLTARLGRSAAVIIPRRHGKPPSASGC